MKVTMSKTTSGNNPYQADGMNGTNGINGVAGPMGNPGLTGATGGIGPQGMPGSQGVTGDQGIPGTNGVNGSNGLNGGVGAQGTVGVQGVAGASGGIGVTGPAGANGSNGLNGPTGPVGALGPMGIQGATGSIGLTGLTGTSGVNGTNGVNGINTNAGTSCVMWHDESVTLSGSATITSVWTSTYLYSMSMTQAGPTVGDSFYNNFTIAAGTYRLYAACNTGPTSGRAHWYIDDVFQGSMDLYHVTAGTTVYLSVFANITFSGNHVLTCKIESRNSVSTGYLADMVKFFIR